jgi:hypothetical protein
VTINAFQEPGTRRAGYAHLVQRFGLEVIPNWHESLISSRNRHAKQYVGGQVREIYPPSYWPGDTIGDHLEFALKYDGVNLAILSMVLQRIDVSDITGFVESRPTGKYARMLWYFYEKLTGTLLPLDDLTQGNYVDLLDPARYFTVADAERIRRQRLRDNLLGDFRFCPVVRRTQRLRDWEDSEADEQFRALVDSYPAELLRRAAGYLYMKETKSSFQIENIKPSASRTERFIALLRMAERTDFLDKAHLIDLQNRIVDPRFAAADFRSTQNYVGETIAPGRERVHYVPPRPEDLPDLMDGLFAVHERMEYWEIHPVVHAAVVAYAFVLLHPFEDGNGRIHRFLIHNILARRRFTPEGILYPVSASMEKHRAGYDASLEVFSQALLPLLEWSLDEEGRMTVSSDPHPWYRFMDLTSQVESLFAFIGETTEVELVEELRFLQRYDAARRGIRDVVDMPDRAADLLIRVCLQNKLRLSARKRQEHFSFLTDDEVAAVERAVKSVYGEAID